MNRREYGYGQSPSALPRHIRGGISLAYGLWLLVQWPLLAHVYGLTTQFEIYSVSLAAPLLSWYAAQKYCLNMVSAPQMFRPWLSIASALLMIVAARAPFGTSMNVLLSCGGFILLRMSLSAESLGQVMMAGGAVMLFVIPIPASVVDRLVWALQHMHASLIMRLFEPISGIHLTRYGLCLATPWGNYLGLQPECSGIRSLLGMMMLASYYATAERHCWAGLILTCVTTAWVAVSLNFIRIIVSFSFKIAGNSYCGTSGGHELMGLIIIIFGMWMIRFLARHMYGRTSFCQEEVTLVRHDRICGSQFIRPAGPVHGAVVDRRSRGDRRHLPDDRASIRAKSRSFSATRRRACPDTPSRIVGSGCLRIRRAEITA